MVCGFCQCAAPRDSGGTARSLMEAVGGDIGGGGGGAPVRARTILPLYLCPFALQHRLDQAKGVALPRGSGNVSFPFK